MFNALYFIHVIVLIFGCLSKLFCFNYVRFLEITLCQALLKMRCIVFIISISILLFNLNCKVLGNQNHVQVQETGCEFV